MILARALFGAVGLRLQSHDLGLLPATHFSPFVVTFGQRQFAIYLRLGVLARAFARLPNQSAVGALFALSRILLQRSDDSPGRRANSCRTCRERKRSYHQTPLMRFLSLQRSLAAMRCAGLPAPNDPASTLLALPLVVGPRFCDLASPLRFFALRTWCGRA
jgi:hypothetical protein